MKKHFIYLIAVVAIFASCRKDADSVFQQSADDRLNELLAKYQSQLTGSASGWKAIVSPAGGGSYSFYLKFSDANRVTMLSDFDSTSAVTPKESSYRLKALQQPSLIFDTYSYIHVLADPNEGQVVQVDVNGGEVGVGLRSDFEFYSDSTTNDTIKLVGRFNGSKAILVRATTQEATAYNSGQLASGLLIRGFQTYFKRMTVGTVQIDISINTQNRTLTFTYLEGNTVRTVTTGFYFTAGGIVLDTPLTIGGQTISSFNNMTWNAALETINMTVGGTASTIRGIVVPLRVDIGAPKRWWDFAVADNNDYWISDNGFHVNGVDDAYNINSLASAGNTYYYLIYWPMYAANNDFFGPIFLNPAQTGLTLLYGSAPQKPTFTPDGRAVFIQLGSYGAYPATGPAGLTRAKLYNSSSYYFVQTSATTYDMVSASDGKAWVTWRF